MPPGVGSGPLIARMAFKVMQYMGMRTEDTTIMDGGLVARVAGHRQTFKQLLDRAGEISGAQVLASAGAGGKSVDLYLMKSPGEVFHVCLINLQLSSGPEPVVQGIGGFDVGPVESVTIPKELWSEMCPDLCRSKESAQDKGPVELHRKLSQGEIDWQNARLVLKATPIASHVFRIRFKLVANEPSSNYIVLIPKLRTISEGHARYASRTVSVQGVPDSSTTEFGSFVLVNLRGDQLESVSVKHEFVNQQVRIVDTKQVGEDKLPDLPVPVLSPEERASCLSCNGQELRSLLSGQGLGRLSGERDVAYAMRLGRWLRSCNYDVALTDAELKRLPTLIWETKRGDCSAFNVGFVFALRAHQIPARVSLGFKYGQAVLDACGSVVAPHAQSEFFAEGVGWIPCDATAGLHRLGHEATGMLSFLEFRPASLSVADLEDLRKVLGPIAATEANDEDPAYRKEVLLAAGLERHGGQGLPAELTRLCMAYSLGSFRDLRAGDPLTDCARAGAKMFEGGPFRGQPLKLSQLNENMLIPAEIDAVMDHLHARPRAEDWSKMWPYGVISCSYEFEEKQL